MYGGAEVQLERTRESLVRLGVTVDLYSQWDREVLDRVDILHWFHIDPSSIKYRDSSHCKTTRFESGDIRDLLAPKAMARTFVDKGFRPTQKVWHSAHILFRNGAGYFKVSRYRHR